MFENERRPAPGPGCWRLDLPLVAYAVWLDNVLAIEALSGLLGFQRALTVGLEAARQREPGSVRLSRKLSRYQLSRTP
jgi:hypothetical protein